MKQIKQKFTQLFPVLKESQNGNSAHHSRNNSLIFGIFAFFFYCTLSLSFARESLGHDAMMLRLFKNKRRVRWKVRLSKSNVINSPWRGRSEKVPWHSQHKKSTRQTTTESRMAEWAVGSLTRGVIVQNQWHKICWKDSSLWDEHWKRCIRQLPSVSSCSSVGWHHRALYFLVWVWVIHVHVQTCNYSFKKIWR